MKDERLSFQIKYCNGTFSTYLKKNVMLIHFAPLFKPDGVQ